MQQGQGRWFRVIRLTLFCCLLGISAQLGFAEKPATPGAPVNVVNEPTVHAVQRGPWNVVDAASAQPFQVIFRGSYGQDGCVGANFCTAKLLTVPEGKRLILSNMHGFVALTAGDTPLALALQTGAAATSAIFEVPRDGFACFSDTIKSGNPTRCPFNQSFHLVLEPGEELWFDFVTHGSLSTWPTVLVVGGHYVDVEAEAAADFQQMAAPLPVAGPAHRRTVDVP